MYLSITGLHLPQACLFGMSKVFCIPVKTLFKYMEKQPFFEGGQETHKTLPLRTGEKPITSIEWFEKTGRNAIYPDDKAKVCQKKFAHSSAILKWPDL